MIFSRDTISKLKTDTSDEWQTNQERGTFNLRFYGLEDISEGIFSALLGADYTGWLKEEFPDSSIDSYAELSPVKKECTKIIVVFNDGYTEDNNREVELSIYEPREAKEIYETLKADAEQKGMDFNGFVREILSEVHSYNMEYIGSCIDVFDDFLEDRDIRIPTSDEAMKEDGEWDEVNGNPARIYGPDYGELSDAFKKILELTESEKACADTDLNEKNTFRDEKEATGRFREWLDSFYDRYLTDVTERSYKKDYFKSLTGNPGIPQKELSNILREWEYTRFTEPITAKNYILKNWDKYGLVDSEKEMLGLLNILQAEGENLDSLHDVTINGEREFCGIFFGKAPYSDREVVNALYQFASFYTEKEFIDMILEIHSDYLCDEEEPGEATERIRRESSDDPHDFSDCLITKTDDGYVKRVWY